MERLWKVFAACFFIGVLALRTNALAEDTRNWLILKTTENGQPVIVRALGSLPNRTQRETMPWQILVKWRYGQAKNGMPTEAALQSAREIEDDLFATMQKRGTVDLPMVRTGNGMRCWYYYVQDPEAVKASIKAFFEKRRDIDVVVKVHKDENWSELREVLSHVRNKSKAVSRNK